MNRAPQHQTKQKLKKRKTCSVINAQDNTGLAIHKHTPTDTQTHYKKIKRIRVVEKF